MCYTYVYLFILLINKNLCEFAERRIFMTGKYFIRKLPKDYVIEIKNQPSRRISNDKISGYYFPNIYEELRVRPNAACFAKDPFYDVYVVFYQDHNSSSCVFFFKFTKSKNGNSIPTFCRCLGSRAAKKHWKPVLSLVADCMERIKKLSYGDSLEFYSKELP